MSTHAAVNQLDGFTFGSGTYYADLTNLLGNRTVASASLQSQSNADPDTGEAAGQTDLTVGSITALASDTSIYDGPDLIGTIATGKGFSCSISGGGVALYTLVFSVTDSAGNVDGVKVQLNVE